MPMHKIQVNLSDYPSVIALFEGLVENFDKDEVIDLGRVDDPSFTVDGTFVTLPIIAEGQEELYRQGTIANELVHYLVDKYLDGKVPLQVNEFLSDAASVAVDPLTEIPRIHKHNWKQYRKSVRHMAEQLRIGLGRRSKLFDYDFLNSLIDEEPEKVRELVLEVLRENCSDEQQFVKDLQASYKKKAREFIKQHLPQQGD